MTEEILRAHVICVVYAVNDDDTIDRISSYWLPIIRQTLGESHKVPIILVGNKIDLVDYTTMEVRSIQFKQNALYLCWLFNSLILICS